MAARALYLHIPFCKRRCRYCDFASSTAKHADQRAYAYTQKLISFLAQCQETCLFEPTLTGYIGGGTPTMLGPELLEQLLQATRTCGRFTELTFEANPDTLDAATLKCAKRAGATRISLGVQSFIDNELEALGRVHNAATAERALKAAVKSGLNTSCDLMCGIPYQSFESWRYSLKKALATGISHISIYPLMIEEGTAMERLCEEGALPWPSDDDQATYMEIAEEVLTAAGMQRYEVASYAKPACACQHNIAYWTGTEYLGLGTSGSSMFSRATYEKLKHIAPQLPALKPSTTRVRITCTSSIDEVIAAPNLAGLSFETEEMNKREAMAEDLMLGARMSQGFSQTLVDQARPLMGASLDQTFNTLINQGLLIYANNRYQPTHQGWLLGNELYGALWGLAED